MVALLPPDPLEGGNAAVAPDAPHGAHGAQALQLLQAAQPVCLQVLRRRADNPTLGECRWSYFNLWQIYITTH